MKKITANAPLFLSLLALFTPVVASANAGIDFRLRFESVAQDNVAKDANALTLRTKLHYKTQAYSGWSGFVEVEDSRVVLGIEDYNNTLGDNTDHSVIADPETTELDQGFVQYKSKRLTAKIGRQVLTFDNHRFVGHVGWRQDKQTFDGATLAYQVNDKLFLNYGYLVQRNRIFTDVKDFDSKDHLFNASYKTSIGKLTGYGYLLEVDEGVENSLDTFGVRLAGKKDKFSYIAEVASQSSETTTSDYSATYLNLEGGYNFGKVTAKLGYELLGSDGAMYGFSTPLATLHKFNGWSDQFLGTPKQGLADVYISVAGKAMGGSWLVAYHDFSADDSTAEVDDLGSELNAVFSKQLNKTFSAGIKLAAYSAGDAGAGKVDTDKVWAWIGAKF